MDVPSLKVSSGAPWASATTWLFVTRMPSSSMTNPEPVAWPCEVSTLICTTLGSTRAATPATLPSGRETLRAGAAPRLAPSTVTDPCRSVSSEPSAPPASPATRAIATASATSRPVRLPPAGRGSRPRVSVGAQTSYTAP